MILKEAYKGKRDKKITAYMQVECNSHFSCGTIEIMAEFAGTQYRLRFTREEADKIIDCLQSTQVADSLTTPREEGP